MSVRVGPWDDGRVVSNARWKDEAIDKKARLFLRNLRFTKDSEILRVIESQHTRQEQT